MRTVVKAVLRSLSASTVNNFTSVEGEMIEYRYQMEIVKLEQFSITSSVVEPREVTKNFVCKQDSLSPVYQLSRHEETNFEQLQDKECDYYPNISNKGDINVLNIDLKDNISEVKVNSSNIIVSLKNIRFINSIVFNEKCDVFLTTANYIQRLLNVKAVKQDLVPFMSIAMFDLALEKKVGKGMVEEQLALVLSLLNIPLNHIEDFPRMKAILLKQLKYDLASITVVDYIEILLKVDFHVPESHHHLKDLICILATSVELTQFTLACQALSLVSVAARHLSFDKSFSKQFSDIIGKFPMIFVSPVRLNQFAKLDNVNEENIKQCAEYIVRYISKYYNKCLPISLSKTFLVRNVLKVERETQLCTVIEEDERLVYRSRQPFDIIELMEKFDKVHTAISCKSNGKQKQRHKHMKKRLRRQLKRCGLDVMRQSSQLWTEVEDDDSAISSSSEIVSPSNSPELF